MADGTDAGRLGDPPAAGATNQANPPTLLWNGDGPTMPERLGRYRIKKRLGGGGMGAVYLVWWRTPSCSARKR